MKIAGASRLSGEVMLRRPALAAPAVVTDAAANWTLLRSRLHHEDGAATRPLAAEGEPMRTLHFGLRVADLERSLAFYTAVGYEVVGSVPETAFGHLTMLKLPDDDFVTIELVHDPTNGAADLGAGLNHFDAPVSPDDSDDFRTTWITDPDGNRIELVQWPAGHPDGITAADWPG